MRQGATTLVIPYQQRGLGNQLVFSAHVMAFARRHGLRVLNPALAAYGDAFEGTQANPLCQYPPPRARWARRSVVPRRLRLYAPATCRRVFRGLTQCRLLRHDRLFDMGRDHAQIPKNLSRLEQAVERSPQRVLCVFGWSFRDVDSVARFGSEVREFFTPAEPVARTVREFTRRLRREADVLIGIHVRRGDYNTFKGGRFFYSVETYADLVRRTRALFPPERRVAFVVSSNDPPAAEQLLAECAGLPLHPAPGGVIEDLYTLAACDYIVAPQSTFSKWASFYGETPLYQVEEPVAPFTLDDFKVYAELPP